MKLVEKFEEIFEIAYMANSNLTDYYLTKIANSLPNKIYIYDHLLDEEVPVENEDKTKLLILLSRLRTLP